MANKHPKTRLVNIPAQFLPLLEKERDQKGLFSLPELMGQILRDHFGIKRPREHNNQEGSESNDTIIKGVKSDG